MKFFPVLLLSLTLAACAHKGSYEDVRPGEEGLNSVKLKVNDEVEGSREAIRQARDYCKELDKKPAIVDEKTRYVGEMSEENYKRLKRASKAAGTISGGVLGTKGDQAIDEYSGVPYEVEMKFRCVENS